MIDLEKSLLATIDASPGEVGPRLVYADWLEETGQTEKAEVVRTTARDEADCHAMAATLMRLFPMGDRYSKNTLTVKAYQEVEIVYGAMYDAPDLPPMMDLLTELAALFGTKKIDVDRYADGGCESCDWGSDYGHTFQIKDASERAKSVAKFLAVRGDLYEKGRKR